VLVLSLPVAWLVWLGTRDLPQIALQRNWSVFGFSLTVSPLIILLLELLLFLVGLVFVLLLAPAFFPDAMGWIEELAGMFEAAADSMEVPEQALIDLVQSPVVVAAALLFTAGVVPLIEEAIKPMAVWLAGGRRLTPEDGWVLGLLSGAGFTLVENLGNLVIGQGWAFLVLARAGAAGLHMFNSAIIGYTFVLSHQRKKWRPFILTFLGAVGLHALWNAVAVMATLRSVTDPVGNYIGWPLGYLAILATASLATYAAIGVVNKRLAETEINENVESEINNND
jgi:RsiW-degrading membrane proteinase PrsW (M82 family)